MANKYTVQYAKINTAAAGTTTTMAPNELGGRVRCAYFTLNTTDTAVNVGDVVYCTKLPRGARVVDGTLVWGAMGGTASIKMGTNLDDDCFLAAGTSVVSLGTAILSNADVLPDLLGQVPSDSAEVDVIITAAGSNFAGAKVLSGVLFYVVD